MFDLYVTIRDKTTEVMILDRDVLRARSYLQRNRECDCPLIVFVECDWILEKTVQYHRGVSLKFEHEINILHKTHKR